MQFSKIKKRIKAFLAPSLQTRIDIFATSYRKFHDETSRVWITFDGKQIFSAEDVLFDRERQKKYNEATHTLPPRPAEFNIELFKSVWHQKSTDLYDEIGQQLHNAGMLDNYSVQKGLIQYPNLSIREALAHDNVFIRGFALLDSRVGKRTLAGLPNQLSPFEQLCYNIRLQAEKEYLSSKSEE